MHHCTYESLHPTVETKEVLESLETLRVMFPADYQEKYKRVLQFHKHAHTE